MNKVVVIGAGFVGMSYAYAQLNQGGINELVIIDINKEKSEGEALDLNHGLPFAPDKIVIKSGDYTDCKDADICVITAGSNQKEGESRIDLLSRNKDIMISITNSVVESGFNGIFLIASNPVDIMSTVVLKTSNFDRSKVIGSGTTLDSARVSYELSKRLNVDSRDIHSFVLGEHGDSEFVVWSKTNISVKPIRDIVETSLIDDNEFSKIERDVKESAYEIIEKKGSTYYGIGMALVRIVSSILNDENTILPLSTYLEGEYGFSGCHISVPVKVSKVGISKIIELNLNDEEHKKFENSFNTLKELVKKIST